MVENAPPQWAPDPRRQHAYRYWDGTRWTEYVSDDASMPPPPPGPPPSPPPAVRMPTAFNMPLEVLLVALGLLALGGLVLYPALRYGLPGLTDLGASDEFSRAFAALDAYLVLIMGGIGVGLIALAVGVLRANRACQLLTCFLCGVVGLVALIVAGQAGMSAADDIGGDVAVVVLVCTAVIVLLMLPGARRFFGQSQSPVGVDMAMAVGLFLGSTMLLSGAALLPAGNLGAEFVGWGLGEAFAGAGVLLLNRFLRAGRPAARIAVTLCYLVYVVLDFVEAHHEGMTSSPTTLLPLGIALIALGGLWGPPSSHEHFAHPRRADGWQPALVALFASIVAGVVVLGAVGAAEASHGSSFGDQATLGLSGTSGSIEPSIDEEQAREEADAAFQAMSDGSADANTCDGTDLPSLPISDYSIDEVSPSTQGTFDVSADVTLTDGTTEVVTVRIGTASDGSACAQADSVQANGQAPPSAVASAPVSAPGSALASGPPAVTEPDDVPSVPSADDPVPTDASPPGQPQEDIVVPYTDSGSTPTSSEEIVEYQPDGLTPDEEAAVADVIDFMVRINQQDFDDAWADTTNAASGDTASAAFRRGYATSRYYQVAFGQPEQLASDLIAVPSRWVSRQEPGAQGYPAGVTDCSYWPQYVFLLAYQDGQWRYATSSSYERRAAVQPLLRMGEDGQRFLNPVAQRVAC